MKSHLVTVFVLAAFFFFGFAEAAAHKQAVEPKELYDLKANAQRSLNSRHRRVESNNEMLEDGVVVRSAYSVHEYLGEGRERYLSRRTEGERKTEHESIFLGYFRYTRTDGGPWSKTDLRQPGSGSGSGSGSGRGSSCSVRQLTVESVFLGANPARLFEQIEISSHDGGMLVEEERTWFGENGDLLQEESTTGMYSPRTVMIRSWVKYEYDPNIKLEAPIS